MGQGPYSKQAFFVGVRVLNDWYVFNKMYYINNLFQMTKTILIPMWNHAFPRKDCEGNIPSILQNHMSNNYG